MLITEAKWLGDKIYRLDTKKVFPLLNVGSSTGHFRKDVQPWIEQYIFAPARKNNEKVFHLDLKREAGVDLVGDLENPKFVKKLIRQKYKAVLCSNLFEHLKKRKRLAKTIFSILVKGGYLFVSCPYKYPYHPDPIDTFYRPNPSQLAKLFPKAVVIDKSIIVCGNYLSYISRSPKILVKSFLRLLLPFYKPKEWLTLCRHLPWLFKRFEASAVVLRKL